MTLARHRTYFQYVKRHRGAVYRAGLDLMPILTSPFERARFRLRLLIHDWSKFLPSEWLPYARTFYNPDGSKADYAETPEFTKAWMLHQHRHPHHWQWHIITADNRPLRHTNLMIWDVGRVSKVMPDAIYGVPLGVRNIFTQEPMKRLDILEMLADWWGAGFAINGKSSWQAVHDWYANQKGMLLHPVSRETVERILSVMLIKEQHDAPS